MKNKLIIFSGAFFLLMLFIFLSSVYIEELTLSNRTLKEINDEYRNSFQEREIYKGNCIADECLEIEGLEYPVAEVDESIKEALNEAIQDEYKAWSTYDKVIVEFGEVRPFIMIIRSEEQHIASLKALFDKYGLEIPENTWPERVDVPESLSSACSIGVEAEIANAALYKDKLIPAVNDYPDIVMVFNELMSASENRHLPAFERCK